MLKEYLPEILKKLRLERNMSQAMIEELTGIDRTTISAYEKGIRDPSLKNLIKLANLYKVSLDYLCGRINRKTIDITDESDATQKRILVILYNNLYNKVGEKK